MKDAITMGTIAGFIGGIVGLVFSYSMFFLGISPISSVHLAASLVVTDILNLSMGGFLWSIITHLTVSAAFGIILAYIIRYSGRENWWLKGAGTGAIICLIAHSYLIPLMRTDLRGLIFNAPSFGTMITTHSLIGLMASFIIVKYGDGS